MTRKAGCEAVSRTQGGSPTRSLTTSGTRRLAIPYRDYTRGLHAYRVVKPGDSHHVNGHSRTVYIRVR
jgi:hypothetical protein